MLPHPLRASHDAMLACASLWTAVCGLDGVWPCGGVWPREMGVEGRRRPKKAEVGARALWPEKEAVVVICFRSCDITGA